MSLRARDTALAKNPKGALEYLSQAQRSTDRYWQRYIYVALLRVRVVVFYCLPFNLLLCLI